MARVNEWSVVCTRKLVAPAAAQQHQREQQQQQRQAAIAYPHQTATYRPVSQAVDRKSPDGKPSKTEGRKGRARETQPEIGMSNADKQSTTADTPDAAAAAATAAATPTPPTTPKTPAKPKQPSGSPEVRYETVQPPAYSDGNGDVARPSPIHDPADGAPPSHPHYCLLPPDTMKHQSWLIKSAALVQQRRDPSVDRSKLFRLASFPSGYALYEHVKGQRKDTYLYGESMTKCNKERVKGHAQGA